MFKNIAQAGRTIFKRMKDVAKAGVFTVTSAVTASRIQHED
jgi:hypothetical protein